jgi:hypothetical protein
VSLILFGLKVSNLQTTQLMLLLLKLNIMKKKIVGFALIIAAFMSVTTGCFVRGGYGHHHHHRGY